LLGAAGTFRSVLHSCIHVHNNVYVPLRWCPWGWVVVFMYLRLPCTVCYPQTLNVSGCTSVTVRGLRNLSSGMPYTELASSYFGLKPKSDVVQEKVSAVSVLFAALHQCCGYSASAVHTPPPSLARAPPRCAVATHTPCIRFPCISSHIPALSIRCTMQLRLQSEMIRDSAAVMVQKHFKRYRVEYTLGREALYVYAACGHAVSIRHLREGPILHCVPDCCDAWVP
jgi:hypothetical protein